MGADTIATAPDIVRGRGAARSMPQRRCPAGEQQGRQRGGARDEIEQHDFPPLGRHVPLDEVEDAVDQRRSAASGTSASSTTGPPGQGVLPCVGMAVVRVPSGSASRAPASWAVAMKLAISASWRTRGT